LSGSLYSSLANNNSLYKQTDSQITDLNRSFCTFKQAYYATA
jgi:hypothetical protein